MSQRVKAVSRGMLAAVAVAAGLAVAPMTVSTAKAADLSDKSVAVLMNYAWAVMPSTFTSPSGKVIKVDKTKKKEIIAPSDVAREVIKVARLSAHAQICKLQEEQILNYNTLMKREDDKKKWNDQQMLYISTLHLFTVMWLTGNVQITEKDGENQVSVDEPAAGTTEEDTCTDEQKAKVKEQITTYIKGS